MVNPAYERHEVDGTQPPVTDQRGEAVIKKQPVTEKRPSEGVDVINPAYERHKIEGVQSPGGTGHTYDYVSVAL